MPEDQFSLFPNWDDPNYRRYWLKHNLSYDTWTDYSGADIWRAMASAGRYVSRNMLYSVRSYVLGQSGREGQFSALDPENGIPRSLMEEEPYWNMSSDYMYVINMKTTDDEGNTVITSRAISTDDRLTPQEVFERAEEIFNRKGYVGYIGFEDAYIAHVYRR